MSSVIVDQSPSVNYTELHPFLHHQHLAPYYAVIIPILLLFCLFAFFGNLALLACVPWIRRTAMTFNLRLSLSLAAADSWAALLIFCGIIVNSYMPVVFDVKLGPLTACYFLILEFLRLAGLITSVLHLLTLAVNHWLSIAAPLKYKTMVSTTVFKSTTVVLWTAPVMAMFGYGFSMPTEAFRNPHCAYSFYYRFRFRFILFLQFVLPLLVMLLVYGDILRRLTLSRGDRGEWRVHSGHERASQTRKRESWPWCGVQPDASNSIDHKSEHRKRASLLKGNSTSSRGSLCSPAGKTKALFTTLLIVGSFAAGWLPALLVFLLVCTDCVVNASPSNMAVFAVQVLVNTLMLTKLLLNPFIYGFRMLDIRFALWAMRATRFGTRPLSLAHIPHRYNRFCSQNLRQR